MNKIVGTWIGPSDETYEFDGVLCTRICRGFDRGAPTTSGYSINGTTLTLVVSIYPEDKEKIQLTFSDDGNRVRFDWIDGTGRRWDGVMSVCLRRKNTEKEGNVQGVETAAVIDERDNELLPVEGESSHRLENVVLSAYKEKIDGGEENPRHNEGSLFLFFADAARFYDEEHRNAYRMVIQDVLDHMERSATIRVGITCIQKQYGSSHNHKIIFYKIGYRICHKVATCGR